MENFIFCAVDVRIISKFQYFVNTSEQLWFSDVFRGYRNSETVVTLF